MVRGVWCLMGSVVFALRNFRALALSKHTGPMLADKHGLYVQKTKMGEGGVRGLLRSIGYGMPCHILVT